MDYSSLDTLFYYFKSYPEDYVELYFVDNSEHHRTDLKIEYPGNTNSIRTTFSNNRDKLAVIFLEIVGDPTLLMTDAFVYLIDLNNLTMLNDFELTFENHYFSSLTYYAPTWEKGDLSWNWQDTIITFNMRQHQIFLDTETGRVETKDWSTNPWQDDEYSSRLPMLESGQFDFLVETNFARESSFLPLHVIL